MARTCLLSCFAFVFAVAAEAKAVAEVSQQEGENIILKAIQLNHVSGGQTPLQPALEPESSKKFFSKDYPRDQSPPRNGLHFKHPYPAVQDSGDFDRDFVKDQNTDNGEFQAQQNYDRIRHAIQEQYEKTARALAKKKAAEKELEATLEDFKEDINEAKVKEVDHVNDLKEIEKAKKFEEQRNAQTKTTPSPQETKKEGCMWPWSMWCCGWWPWSCPSKSATATETDAMDKFRDAHEELATDLAGAARQVEDLVRQLKECEKELAEAQKELVRLLDALQQAKMKKVEADEKVKQAKLQEDKAEERVAVLKEKLAEEIAEHAAAEAAYLKEKAKVDQLIAELNVLAKKVKALRDAEDKDGGVYPVPDDVARRPRSSAKVATVSLSVVGMFAALMY